MHNDGSRKLNKAGKCIGDPSIIDGLTIAAIYLFCKDYFANAWRIKKKEGYVSEKNNNRGG